MLFTGPRTSTVPPWCFGGHGASQRLGLLSHPPQSILFAFEGTSNCAKLPAAAPRRGTEDVSEYRRRVRAFGGKQAAREGGGRR